MNELLWNLVVWNYPMLLSLESIRNDPLGLVMIAVSFLASSPGVLITIALVYWCVNKSVGRGASYVMIFSASFNVWLKGLWSIPRPYHPQLDPVLDQAGISQRVTPLDPIHSKSPSFPSGHSQGVIVLWGYLAASFKRPWLWVVSLCLIVLVPFTRMYLSVHFLQDVVVGVLVGGIWLVIWLLLEARLRPWIASLATAWRYGLAVAVPLGAVLLYPVPDLAAQMGALAGLGVGFVLEGGTLRFDTGGLWWKRALRGLVGLIILSLVYLGLHLTSGSDELGGYTLLTAWTVVGFGLMGFVAAWVVPWFLIRIGLMGREASD